ncbi:MAG TPA: prepilin-type N-terminal cleavage/methylation domain-containing protein [Blastocatellia bacterium]|jgi:prepilin-type N-terminal cleavage/methylation domain-containing protein|nr:prepilin-type N-terminal cleavage/methylation domain-containing protein [Blastocatellia bacterium]
MNKEYQEECVEQGESGMTLIEVMVSLVVLGAVLVSLGQGLTLGIRLNTDAKMKVGSLNLCKRITERFKSEIQFSYDSFDNANTNAAFNGTFYVDGDGNNVQSTETTPAGGNPTSVFQVTATVGNWTNSGGNTLSAGGVVLVKYLDVKVRPMQSAVIKMNPNTAASREVTMRVEMVRPSL